MHPTRLRCLHVHNAFDRCTTVGCVFFKILSGPRRSFDLIIILRQSMSIYLFFLVVFCLLFVCLLEWHRFCSSYFTEMDGAFWWHSTTRNWPFFFLFFYGPFNPHYLLSLYQLSHPQQTDSKLAFSVKEIHNTQYRTTHDNSENQNNGDSSPKS